MTKQQEIASFLAEMHAEDTALRREEVLQFDGSPTWDRFTLAMSSQVTEMAERLLASGEVVGPAQRPSDGKER